MTTWDRHASMLFLNDNIMPYCTTHKAHPACTPWNAENLLSSILTVLDLCGRIRHAYWRWQHVIKSHQVSVTNVTHDQSQRIFLKIKSSRSSHSEATFITSIWTLTFVIENRNFKREYINYTAGRSLFQWDENQLKNIWGQLHYTCLILNTFRPSI